MKILCFSDWRVQSFEMMKNMVESHNPDLILYAGDDLERLIMPHDSLILKTQNHFVKLKYPEMEPILKEQKKLLTPKLKDFLKTIKFKENYILEQLNVPFIYVNGNDDFFLFEDGSYYMKIHDNSFLINRVFYKITETSKRKITIEEGDWLSFIFTGTKDNAVNAVFGCGIYVPVAPSFGNVNIKLKNEEITIFGVECEYGLNDNTINKPDKYADMYLSHLPPKGTLDLSVRFGIDHIGSKKLLDAIKKYKPKLVICGHSHIWGGNSEKIGDTLVINVSSNDGYPSPGNYALINTDNWSVETKQIKEKTIFSIRGLNTVKINLKQTFRRSRIIVQIFLLENCKYCNSLLNF